MPAADVVSADQLKYGTHLADQAGNVSTAIHLKYGDKTFRGMDFAGSLFLHGPRGVSRARISRPIHLGIPDRHQPFLNVMRTGQVRARNLSPIMPVMVYKNLTDDDLKAIFAFLRTTKPVKHRVDNSEAPTECKLCKQKHGGGSEN